MGIEHWVPAWNLFQDMSDISQVYAHTYQDARRQAVVPELGLAATLRTHAKLTD